MSVEEDITRLETEANDLERQATEQEADAERQLARFKEQLMLPITAMRKEAQHIRAGAQAIREREREDPRA